MLRSLVLLTFLVFSNTVMSDGMITKKSAHSVQATLDRLENIVKKKGFTVFTRVDHAAGATKVGESLRPTQLLLFGNPKVGTGLMTSSQTIGIDLPIKVLAWEDESGTVWLGYNEPRYLVDRHGIKDREPIVEKMTGALKGLTDAAASL